MEIHDIPWLLVFLYFVEKMGPLIPTLLEGKRKDVNGPLEEYFLAAAKLMEEEIVRRLRSAILGIENGTTESAYSDLIRRAPRDLIGLFNTSCVVY